MWRVACRIWSSGQLAITVIYKMKVLETGPPDALPPLTVPFPCSLCSMKLRTDGHTDGVEILLVIPVHLRSTVVLQLHDAPTAGRLGVTHTHDRYYSFLPTVRCADTMSTLATCANAASSLPRLPLSFCIPSTFLQNLSFVWNRIHLALTQLSLPVTNGCRGDRLSNQTFFLPENIGEDEGSKENGDIHLKSFELPIT